MQPLRINKFLSLLTDLPEFNFAVESSCENVVTVERWTKAGDAERDQVTVSALHLDSADLRCRTALRDLASMTFSYNVQHPA